MKKLCFVINNEDKFKEIKRIIPNLEILKLHLDEIQSLDSKEIIKHKLRQAAKFYPDYEFIVEDTSLYIEGMNGLPGPLVKFFESSIGLTGISNFIEKYGDKAIARSTIGYYKNGKACFFDGEVIGRIVMPRGDKDFGWGKIFVPNGYEQTFAEMGPEEKDKISMRSKAIKELKEYLEKNGKVQVDELDKKYRDDK